ncbi:antibiotic biosynthesis monooxygenase [Streptomyces sp. IBSBF 2953]|uniref:Lct33 n=1 Tax=Streptomyces rishiriensis TaxID=68264 RepID=B0LJ16_STRRH|nr:antibiotic biosynthesis monooxygenase family protein [Streptomyces scabiei]ABX71116.1 Lct33 [Streptomyces rishiriensis]MCQ9184100.1 antibiotic biosynthesis monooxygenase [Streptomyces hayashii]MDX3117008.1 antibiotic biosynthesis monooxygenase [Streptomyces scabiei]
MGTIARENDYYTLVNVFTVTPENQGRIYDAVIEATDIIEKFPGFVSANVHRSDDGTRVINYAQWRSKDEFDAMRAHPDVQDHFRACRAITDDIVPIFCEVTHVHRSPSAGLRHAG